MQKQYRLRIPSFITVETEDGSWIGEKDAQKTEKDDVVVTYETTPEAEEVWLTADQTKVKTIKFRWNTPVNKKSRILGGSWERTYGDVDWKGVSGSRFMPWYFLAAVGETVTGYGVKVRPSAMCFWQADTRGITLVMDVRCGGIGVQLSGRKLRAAQIVAMQTEGMGTFESAREFCKVMCTDPIFPDYPVYGSNNWYYAYGDSSEEEILQDTDYIVELTQGVDNPPYMVIDDCWQEHHRLDEYNGGPWKKGNIKFPDMGALAKKLEEKGVRPGIWVRFLLNEEETIPQEWRLSHNDCLDPSHPGVLSYIQEDNNKKLDAMRQTVDEKLQKTLEEKMTQSFQLVNERLEQAKLTGVACGKNDPGKGKRHLQQPLLPRACLHEQGAQAGKRLLILEREAGGNRTVQIQHAEHLPILHQGNHQLRRGGAVTGDMAGKGMHIRYQLCLPGGRGCAANPFSKGDGHAGGFALEGPQQQRLPLAQIEACPVQLRQALIQERSHVGHIGQGRGYPFHQGSELCT